MLLGYEAAIFRETTELIFFRKWFKEPFSWQLLRFQYFQSSYLPSHCGKFTGNLCNMLRIRICFATGIGFAFIPWNLSDPWIQIFSFADLDCLDLHRYKKDLNDHNINLKLFVGLLVVRSRTEGVPEENRWPPWSNGNWTTYNSRFRYLNGKINWYFV